MQHKPTSNIIYWPLAGGASLQITSSVLLPHNFTISCCGTFFTDVAKWANIQKYNTVLQTSHRNMMGTSQIGVKTIFKTKFYEMRGTRERLCTLLYKYTGRPQFPPSSSWMWGPLCLLGLPQIILYIISTLVESSNKYFQNLRKGGVYDFSHFPKTHQIVI